MDSVDGSMVIGSMGYNLLINGIYFGYNLLMNGIYFGYNLLMNGIYCGYSRTYLLTFY